MAGGMDIAHTCITRALWMLIQKQICFSRAIFVGSIFSSRFISVLGAQNECKSRLFFTKDLKLLQSFLPDSIQHFRGILKFVLIYMYPWENYHPRVFVAVPIYRTTFFRVCVGGIIMASRAPTIGGIVILQREGA
jgi:hypothetical protein